MFRFLVIIWFALILIFNTNALSAEPITINNSLGQKFVLIKPGKFMMGSPAAETARKLYPTFFDLEAQKEVEIKRMFWLSCYETTQAEYEQIMGNNPSHFSLIRAKERLAGVETRRLPVEEVTWLQAVEFCRKLSDLPAERQAGRTYRLPTEEEWEYACRAGSTTPFCYGDHADGTEFNCCGKVAHHNLQEPAVLFKQGIWLQRTTVVGSYAPNAWGLYDMHGNVSEWTASAYRAEQRSKTDHRYTLDPTGDYRCNRGGSNGLPAQSGRSACRVFKRADYTAFGQIGFRVVMEIADKK
jgi:formylglycine-generating enzyme required for sulfatase activity